MINAMPIKIINSLDNKATTWLTDAPNTLRTPISFLRCSEVKADKPNNPKAATKMEIPTKPVRRLLSICSLL